MHILSLQPYFGGSHKAFQTQWQANSRHQWTVLSLPPRHWKWRMRHAAVYFAEQLVKQTAEQTAEQTAACSNGFSYDAIFCSDFLNLAEFKGLVPPKIRRLPAVVYFHENQFAYPSRRYDERDLHFGFTNFTSCLAAEQVWFNSAFNRDSFFEGLDRACEKWPDFQPVNAAQSIRSKCRIEPPGVDLSLLPNKPGDSPNRTNSKSNPQFEYISLVWAARWEHDKNPDLLLSVLRELKKRGTRFRISVIGESFRRVPEAFETIRKEFAPLIDRWGFQSRSDYWHTLDQSDVFISTADHEFFGISAAEAIAMGAFPILPNRLAYPELIRQSSSPERQDLFLYDGSAADLCQKVEYFAHHQTTEMVEGCRRTLQAELIEDLEWRTRAPSMDDQIAEICDAFSPIG